MQFINVGALSVKSNESMVVTLYLLDFPNDKAAIMDCLRHPENIEYLGNYNDNYN